MDKKEVRIKLQLKKPARGSGGDRYEGEYEGKKITLYFPQNISRPYSTVPANQLMLSVDY